MRLKSKYEGPIGGWYFEMPDGTILKAQNPGLNALERRVAVYMRGNNIQEPDNLLDIIEDQLCQRQPEGKCRYDKKAGDMISLVIHKVAGAIDLTMNQVGFKTNLKQKARGCQTCGQRRVALNSFRK